MAFNFSTKLSAVHSIMSDANTVTASFDLSSNLNTRIQFIEKDDPNVRPAREDQYPFLWIWIDRFEQDFDEIGVTANTGITKKMRISYKILAAIHKSGMTAQHKNALNEIYVLADNINTLFQSKYTLSNTALWVNPRAGEFLQPVGMGGNYIKGAIIDLEAEYLYR